jgi:hypothetical protein
MMLGGTIYKSNMTSETAFTEMLEQSTFQYIHSHSTGGILFAITVPDGKSPYRRFRSNDFGSDVNQLVMKIVFIDNKQRIRIEEINREFCQTTENGFLSEVAIQNNLYKQSMDEFAEPITPRIVYHTYERILTPSMRRFFAHLSASSHKNTISVLKLIERTARDNNTGIGIIAMESFLDMVPIDNIIPDWNLGTTIDNVLPDLKMPMFLTSVVSQKIPYLFAYELLRMYARGYIHGDPHLGNALYAPNYNYISGMTGKIFLIDFGRSYPTKSNRTSYMSILRENIPTKYWSYQWLETIIHPRRKDQTIQSLDYITTQRKKEKMRFKNTMTNQMRLDIVRDLELVVGGAQQQNNIKKVVRGITRRAPLEPEHITDTSSWFVETVSPIIRRTVRLEPFFTNHKN